MIRPTTPQDTPAILAFLVATGLFTADEIEPLERQLQAAWSTVAVRHEGVWPSFGGLSGCAIPR